MVSKEDVRNQGYTIIVLIALLIDINNMMNSIILMKLAIDAMWRNLTLFQLLLNLLIVWQGISTKLKLRDNASLKEKI